MDSLNAICSEYIGNPNYVFKSCDKYILVLEKLPDTITNESRSKIADPIYAKYRANKLKVILIVNKFDLSDILDKIKYISFGKKMIYEKDKIIKVHDYDMDLNKVCTTGLDYFKTIESAYYWELFIFCPKYTGKYIEWYENGKKEKEGEYLDGIKIGKWIYWYGTNANISCEGEYLNGIKIGKWIFFDGKKTGKWIYYDDSGNKKYEI